MALLEVKDLHTSFFTEAGEVKAVNGVSFNLEKGKVLGIVGESGSGKSVTALSLLGLLPYPKAFHSSNSSIKFNDKELIGYKDIEKTRGDKIAFIAEDDISGENPNVRLLNKPESIDEEMT